MIIKIYSISSALPWLHIMCHERVITEPPVERASSRRVADAHAAQYHGRSTALSSCSGNEQNRNHSSKPSPCICHVERPKKPAQLKGGMARLFSKHHDRYHVHKTLGFLVLLNFAYRGTLLVVKGNAFVYDSTRTLWLSMLLHVLLHVSSFEFSLPQRRNPLAPMIWPAYRAHNAVFAIRNVVGALVLMSYPVDYSRDSPWASRAAARTAFVWLSMGLADLASWYYSQGEATTRGMPYPRSTRESSLRVIKSFYMQCQFHATLLSVTDPSLSFMSVLPIELASFAMTLARKQKISSLQWHLVYSISLWSLYAFMLFKHVDARLALAGVLGGIAKEVRHHLRVNKYVLWAATVFVHDYGHRALNGAGETLPGSTGQALLRLFMFVAAARQFVRLGKCFLVEGILEAQTCEQNEAPPSEGNVLLRVNEDFNNNKRKSAETKPTRSLNKVTTAPSKHD